jgi:GLPGLI family protein
MKKILLSLIFITGMVITSFAQLKEGHVTYKIDATTDNPEMQMSVGMIQGSTMDMYFKEKVTRTEMKMGVMMTVVTISDATSGNVLMLLNGMIGQKAITTTQSDIEKVDSEKPTFEVTLVDETKTIVEYTCKKAILTDAEGNETVFWYTEEIEVSKKGQSSMNELVPGFPMQYEINKSGMKMVMTVTKLEKKLDVKSTELFDMTIPEGYTTMTAEELKAMGM